MDFDLSGLSPSSFEQLIQSIAGRIIGPGIVVFGDGPDGGREATFEGRIPFPSKEEIWDGYVVVQAKYRTRPKTDVRDANWLIEQLKDELSKFTDEERDLRCPTFYILATNVILTPYHKSGGKDKISKVFQEFQENMPLQDFRVWDFDQISTYLRDASDIRRAYAAWITPGDVLSEVMSQLEGLKPDFKSTIDNFMQKDFLSDEYANLEQAGHSVDERIPLSRVFVDLPVSRQRLSGPPRSGPAKRQRGIINKILDAGSLRLDPESKSDLQQRVNKDDFPTRYEPGRFVLIGGPGQGKTTVGQFICQLYRASLLEDPTDRHMAVEVREALTDLKEQCIKEKIDLPKGRRFPIHITLNRFAAKLSLSNPSKPISLLSYLTSRIAEITGKSIEIDDFRKWLGAYPWIVILDGLDEVPASSNRDQVLKAIKDFWIDASDANADVAVVATTRPQGYSENFSPKLYQHWWLAPLSPSRALHYSERLVQARYKADHERKERILERLKIASDDEATRRLMQSPLQVTIMTALVDQIGHAPRERWRLFREFYRVIYQREMERDIPAAQILRNYSPDIDAIHKRAGLLLQVESEKSGQTHARMTSEKLAFIIRDRLVEQGHEGEDLEHLCEAMLRTAAERLVFIVGLEKGEAGFEIRSLQEFMAAEALMDGEDKDLQGRLREISAITSWRNVFLFCAGNCFTERQYLRDTIHTICSELNDVGHDQEAGRNVVGGRLALEILEDGISLRQPKYSRLLCKEVIQILDIPDTDFYRRLANVYEANLDGIYFEAIDQTIRADSIHRSSDTMWRILIPLAAKGVEWAAKFLEQHLPDDPTEISKIILHRGISDLEDAPQRNSIVDRLKNNIPQVRPWLLRPHIGRVIPSLTKETDWLKGAIHAVRFYPTIKNHHYSIVTRSSAKRGTSRGPIDVRVVPVDKGISELMEKLFSMPNPGFGWNPILGALRFMATPDPHNLAEELRNIADSWDSAGEIWCPQEVAPLTNRIAPWPFSACLQCGTDTTHLRRLARLAEDGDLGDTNTWKKAENRWKTKGLTEADLLFNFDQDRPFDRRIESIGLPPVIVGMSARVSEEPTEAVQDLVRIYESIRVKDVKQLILRQISEFCQEYPEIFNNISVEPLIISTLQDEGPSSVFYIDLFCSLPNIHRFIKENLTLIDDFARKKNGFTFDSSAMLYGEGYQTNWQNLFDTFREVYNENPECHGLVILMAGFLRIENFIIEPFRLDIGDFEDEITRVAALTLCLASPIDSKENAFCFAHETLSLVKKGVSIVPILQSLRENGLDGPYVGEYLINIHKDRSILQNNELYWVFEILNEIIDKRTTRLDQRSIWENLGLPLSLYRLLSADNTAVSN